MRKTCSRNEESRMKSTSEIGFMLISSLFDFHRDKMVIRLYSTTIWCSCSILAALNLFRMAYFRIISEMWFILHGFEVALLLAHLFSETSLRLVEMQFSAQFNAYICNPDFE